MTRRERCRSGATYQASNNLQRVHGFPGLVSNRTRNNPALPAVEAQLFRLAGNGFRHRARRADLFEVGHMAEQENVSA